MKKLPMTNIQFVLNALPELEATYLKAIASGQPSIAGSYSFTLA